MANNDQVLKWRFDVSTFRLIGRDLITDRVTALFELVKNCYDANAQSVKVIFEKVGIGKENSVIRIEDDGIGMSFEDIRDKWMVIGTSNKRKNPYSPKPFNRKCVGEKGIGRFAVDKLGDTVSILTKKAMTNNWLNVNINWSDYYHEKDEDSNSGITLFTDLENPYSFEPTTNIEESGTKLIITSLREPWTKSEVEHLIREISKLVSPFSNLSFPFKVHVIAEEFNIDQEAIRSIEGFNMATASFSIDFDKKRDVQQSVFFNKEIKEFQTRDIPIRSFGGIKMSVYYFDDVARRNYRKAFPNNPLDGFKVYRDGIIATPFAETNENPDQKRDILGIDKRLWQDIFSRVSTREFIGTIEITKEGNPDIIDATNRQDFVDNTAYQDLKDFIITQLNAVQEFKIDARNSRKKTNQQGLQDAADDIDRLIDSVSDITKEDPSLKPKLNPLINQAKKTKKSVSTAISEQKKEAEEFTRKENIYLSIMSLQEYAIHITHAVRTTLNQIRDRVEFFYRYYPDPEEKDLFLLYAKEMYEKFITLNKVIDFMLSYSQSNLKPEEIDIKDTFEDIIRGYQNIFQKNGITLQTNFSEKLILNSNRQFFRDILQNLIDNSIKAIAGAPNKIIRCSYEVQENNLVVLISDTGYGIPTENREQVFALYYTTTEEQGGAGVGLYIVKTRVESLKGTIAVVDSEFGETGTTFRISIPFKK